MSRPPNMSKKSDFGLIGLAVMGQNLVLNVESRGFQVSVFNRTTSVTDEFIAKHPGKALVGAHTLEEFVQSLATPRKIHIMVKSTAVKDTDRDAVDAVIEQLIPLLDKDDIVIDGGNSFYQTTERRDAYLAEKGLRFIGAGVSGGEEGARKGPSIMPGGPASTWEVMKPIFESIAAKVDGEPCVIHIGPGGAGHYVKMIHNGIEYGDMQMIAEVWGLLRDGMGRSPAQAADLFGRWNEGRLKSYLVEISHKVLAATDEKTGKPMVDVILDRAGQKGTGRWTAIEAQHLAAPVTAIEAAVAARNLSARLEERRAGEAIFGAAPERIAGDAGLIPALEQALLAGKIASYAQGFGLLVAASGEYGWAVPLPEVAKVWRAGCIIRSAMLDDMARALSEHPGTNLMFAPSFAERIKASHGALRRVVSVAALSGNPAPALGAALAYFDAMRTGRGTANMIQGQRDFFGLHSFERVDESGSHHGPWARG